MLLSLLNFLNQWKPVVSDKLNNWHFGFRMGLQVSMNTSTGNQDQTMSNETYDQPISPLAQLSANTPAIADHRTLDDLEAGTLALSDLTTRITALEHHASYSRIAELAELTAVLERRVAECEKHIAENDPDQTPVMQEIVHLLTKVFPQDVGGLISRVIHGLGGKTGNDKGN